jgi:CheY-like chemotaxis protein
VVSADGAAAQDDTDCVVRPVKSRTSLGKNTETAVALFVGAVPSRISSVRQVGDGDIGIEGIVAEQATAKLKILVVDDDPEVVETTGARLEADGYAVLRAVSAREALQLLDAHPDIFVLFTDIVMPGAMDGFDLAEHAKRLRPGLRVIYTSGYLRDEGVWEGMLLRKPWTPDALRGAIADAVRSPHSKGSFQRRR